METSEQIKQKLDMLDKIYNIRQEDLEQESNKDRQILKGKLNEIKLEEIEKIIEDKLEKIDGNSKINDKKEIIKQIEQLIENYEIQVAYYSEKNYKRGFKDAFLLCNECLKEN